MAAPQHRACECSSWAVFAPNSRHGANRQREAHGAAAASLTPLSSPTPGLWPWQSQRGAHLGSAAHRLHLRDWDPDRIPGRGGSHPVHVGSTFGVVVAGRVPLGGLEPHIAPHGAVPCHTHGTMLSCSPLQVLPHVLHVCQPGLCRADAAADAQLAAPIPLLPLVSSGWCRAWGCRAAGC